jgi:hypothetical protein
MQSANLLLTMAQIAIGLVGFTAVIVTLNPKPIREWEMTDRVNLRILVQVSFVLLFFCLLPYVLAVSLGPDDVWFYGLAAYGIIHVVDVGSFLLNVTKEALLIWRVSACAGFLIALSQVGIAFLGNAVMWETAYVATLIWHVYVIFMAFVLLLYQMRKSKP